MFGSDAAHEMVGSELEENFCLVVELETEEEKDREEEEDGA